MNDTTVPAAIDALVTAWTASDSTLQVFDGEAFDPAATDFVCAGWDDGQNAAVQGGYTPSDAHMAQYYEAYDITCLLSSWLGTKGTPKTCRDKAFAEFKELRAAIAADRTLGNVVMRSYVTTFALTQRDDGAGLMSTIQFAVHVDAMA